jgi:hypothetical protein
VRRLRIRDPAVVVRVTAAVEVEVRPSPVTVGDQLAVPEQDVLDRRLEVAACLDLDARVVAAGLLLDLAREASIRPSRR